MVLLLQLHWHPQEDKACSDECVSEHIVSAGYLHLWHQPHRSGAALSNYRHLHSLSDFVYGILDHSDNQVRMRKYGFCMLLGNSKMLREHKSSCARAGV